MWTTFITTLKVSLRDKMQMFWLFAFPLVLATMFYGMFSGLEEGYNITPVNLGVVADSSWKNAQGAQELIDGLAGKNAEDSEDQPKLVTEVTARSAEEAESLMSEGKAIGFVNASSDGTLALTVSSDTANETASATGSPSLSITVSALNNALSMFNQAGSSLKDIAASHPDKLADPKVLDSLGAFDGFTEEKTLTHFKPDSTARYYYALLGMTCMMSLSFAIHGVTTAQANLSALGIRRSVSPLAKWRQLTASFFSSWLCSFASMFVALIYIRFVCSISVGGHEPAALLAIVAASFAASSMGTFFGSIPKMSEGSKIGLSITLACGASFFAGLYGMYAMQLSDQIQRDAPIFHLINPSKQVANLFYDILYYDSYTPFFTTIGILAIMSAIFLAGSVLLLRRQRYEHI
jgi:hypothetical protein